MEQLATAIRLGVYPRGIDAARRARAGRAAPRLPGDAARGDGGAAQAGLVETTRGRGGGTVVTLKPRHAVGPGRRPDHRGPPPGLAGRARLPPDRRARRRRAGGVARRSTTDGRQQLEQAHAEVAAARKPAEHRQADSRFHLTVASLTDSPRTDRGGHLGAGDPARDAAGDPGARHQHRPLRPAARRAGPRRSWPASRTGPAGSWRSTATTRPRCCAAWWAERDTTGRKHEQLRNDRHLTHGASSSAAIDDGDDRHRGRRLHRHAGPAAGQAAARPLLRRPRGRARHRGLQLPARRRRRHEHRRRLRDLLVGARLRRHGVRPRRADHPAAHPPARHRDGPVRPGLARPLPRRSSRRARSCSSQLDRLRRARLGGAGRHRARVHRLRHDLRGGRATRLPRPDAGQPVQRRLLDPRHHPGRAAAARRSATTCTPPGWTSRAPRASATSASTRSASCTPTR